MADTPYEYDVLNDFPNQIVALDALEQEIAGAVPPITSAAFVSLVTSWIGAPARDTCTITFDDPLSPGDQATLDTVVADHQGIPLPSYNGLVGRQALQTETEKDTDVYLERDGAGNLMFGDQASKVLLEESGSLVYTGDGDVTTVE